MGLRIESAPVASAPSKGELPGERKDEVDGSAEADHVASAGTHPREEGG